MGISSDEIFTLPENNIWRDNILASLESFKLHSILKLSN